MEMSKIFGEGRAAGKNRPKFFDGKIARGLAG